MNEMNERFIVKFVVESEGYKVWDTAWRVFASGSYTLQSDAQAVADRKNANPATPAPAPVDILAAKNERIAALEDEHDHQLRRALRAESELADYKRRFEMENERANGQAGLITRMKAALEQIFEPDAVEIWLKHGQALQAPAPTEAPATVTLTASEIDSLAKIQLKTAGHFAIVPMGSPIDRVIYDCEVDHCSKLSTIYDTAANRAAIASRRKELGLA
jgi:hypothetical protein